ncbi:unnamed protein product [Haemonchus placei]|uniref:Uncharacterized protein n=1 Tax=Haemonchus placei TaxID=6290 RepID=A0A3P8D2A4_HAEPC|nr:unnamed protein product [Haemonchus placei]
MSCPYSFSPSLLTAFPCGTVQLQRWFSWLHTFDFCFSSNDFSEARDELLLDISVASDSDNISGECENQGQEILLFRKQLCPDLIIYFSRANENCAAADSESLASLRLRRIRPAFFNKKTRQILKMSRWQMHQYNAIRGFLTENWEGDLTNITIGVYLSFVRASNLRSNESPFTNHKLESETLLDEKEVVPAGTGTDFSVMYNDAPIMMKIHIFFLKSDGSRGETHSLYISNNCTESGKWIANEGYYRLDVNTGNFVPIYYDPVESDFYY